VSLEHPEAERTRKYDKGKTPSPNEPRYKADKRGEEARARNRRRFKEASDQDRSLIGKHLPEDPKAYFPHTVMGPDDRVELPGDWVRLLVDLSKTPVVTPTKPDLSFATDEESLQRNGQTLEDHGYDIGRLLTANAGTTIWHGSEFRPWGHLDPLLRNHPLKAYLKQVLGEGMDYHFTRELSEDERTDELEAQLARGNHKSAVENEDRVIALLAKDVKHGFCFPFPAGLVGKIKGGAVQPGGVTTQFGLKADGTREQKKRLTHDLTFSITTEDASVNNRVDMDRYPEMYYGWCLTRCIHFAANLRAKHPGRRIFMQKFDYSDAYRRMSHTGRAAAQTILVVASVAYLMLRLAFGGSPNPPCFCAFSETLTDLANEIACSDSFPDGANVPTVEAEHLVIVDYPNDEEPHRDCTQPAFEVPVSVTSRKDCFIDDVVNIFLDEGAERLEAECRSVPLAVHLMSRPHAGDGQEPVPRRPLLGPDKLAAEGRPSEILVVLGWGMDTRRMVVFLPQDKYKAWSTDLLEIIKSGRTAFGELESTIGRLNHASFVIPLCRHFLNEVRRRTISRVRKEQVLRLNTEELEDLKLWSEFLENARDGIHMDLLTVRTPTHLGWSDSCPFGLGGYLTDGRAWRLRVPPGAIFHGDDTVNNVLEFLGMAVNVLLMIEAAREKGERYPCILSLGDNTSAIGWMFKSSRIGPKSIYFRVVKAIARHLTREVLKGEVQITAQHIAGAKNVIADLLSFDGTGRGKDSPLTKDEPSNDELTHRVLTHLPQLVPPTFRISALPEKIVSFVCATMRIIESSWTADKRRGTKISTGPGDDGNLLQKSSDSQIRSWIEYPQEREPSSSGPSFSPSEMAPSTDRRDALLDDVRSRWYLRLYAMPEAVWVRRFGCITGTAPSTSRTRSTGGEDS
jgi:hypothetical protein